jgi:hypothetical protein
MLTPYVFVACEKAIIGKDDVASLIGLFSKITLNVPVGTEIPKEAVSPTNWVIFSIWNAEAGDEVKDYMLGTQILYPDKTQFADIPRNKVKIELGKRSQIIIQLNGFPVGQEGVYTVLSWVEENQQRVLGPIEFKLEVEILRQSHSPTGASK